MLGFSYQLPRIPAFSVDRTKRRGFVSLHRDPFDRMLIAQALCEPMRLVTADAMVATYAPVCGVLIEPVGGA